MNKNSFHVGELVYFYLSSRDIYIYAYVIEVRSSGTVTLRYKLDKSWNKIQLEVDKLENEILLGKEQGSIAAEYMEVKKERINKIQQHQSIIFFQATTGCYLKGTVKSVKNYDVEYEGNGQFVTKKFCVEVNRDGGTKTELKIYPFENKVFASQEEFDGLYKATHQPILYSSKNLDVVKNAIVMISSFFRSQLRSFSNVIAIAPLDVGALLMANCEAVQPDWEKFEKYFSSFKNDNMPSTRNGVERIDLNCPVIIIPIIHDNHNFIIIRHRYQKKIEQELLPKNQLKNNIYDHDLYCIDSHQQRDSYELVFKDCYRKTELFQENDRTCIRWKDIHITEEAHCLSTKLYFLMTKLLETIDTVQKKQIKKKVFEFRYVEDAVCNAITVFFEYHQNKSKLRCNERTILSTDKWMQENELRRDMIQNRYSEDSIITKYGKEQGLNGIWNYDSTKEKCQGNFCYINSVMRCFARINVFRKYFIECMYTSDSSREKNVCDATRAMCCYMYKDTYPSEATYQHNYFDNLYFDSSNEQQGEN